MTMTETEQVYIYRWGTNKKQLAFDYGYQTSVSIEPYLDSDLVKLIDLYDRIHTLVRGNVWVGSMQGFNNIDLFDVIKDDKQKFVHPLKEAQSVDSIWVLYNQLNLESRVQWKDSILQVIEKGPIESVVPGTKPIGLESAWGQPVFDSSCLDDEAHESKTKLQ